MSDFQLTEIVVVDGVPQLKHSSLRNDEDVVQHFLKRLFITIHPEEWDELTNCIDSWVFQARMFALMFPDGKWEINLGGDRVRVFDIGVRP